MDGEPFEQDEDEIDEEALQAMMQAALDGPTPRLLHYMFAHYALRQVVAQDPEAICAILAGDNGTAFLKELWKEVERNVEEGEPIAPDGLECVAHRQQDNHTIAVVQLPPPQAPTEAHYVAIVVSPGKRAFLRRSRATFRYLTLERGVNLDGTPRTAFCEWDNRGHTNYGDGPTPELLAFLQAVSDHIANGRQPIAGMSAPIKR